MYALNFAILPSQVHWQLLSDFSEGTVTVRPGTPDRHNSRPGAGRSTDIRIAGPGPGAATPTRNSRLPVRPGLRAGLVNLNGRAPWPWPLPLGRLRLCSLLAARLGVLLCGIHQYSHMAKSNQTARGSSHHGMIGIHDQTASLPGRRWARAPGLALTLTPLPGMRPASSFRYSVSPYLRLCACGLRAAQPWPRPWSSLSKPNAPEKNGSVLGSKMQPNLLDYFRLLNDSYQFCVDEKGMLRKCWVNALSSFCGWRECACLGAGTSWEGAVSGLGGSEESSQKRRHCAGDPASASDSSWI